MPPPPPSGRGATNHSTKGKAAARDPDARPARASSRHWRSTARRRKGGRRVPVSRVGWLNAVRRRSSECLGGNGGPRPDRTVEERFGAGEILHGVGVGPPRG